MKLDSYEEIIAYLNNQKNRPKHLLLGNGFSMAYDKDIFSYNALSNFINNTEDELLKKLFSIINTFNFEQIMKQLDLFYKLSVEFAGDKNLGEKVIKARDSLKNKLIDAISELHPEQVFKIPPEKSQKCACFLKEFLDKDGHVFTTNYDLLLYWVLMRNQDILVNFVDGFGKERIENEEYDPDSKPEYGDLEWGPNKGDQRVHYIHGALHLFDKGISIEKEIYDGDYLLTNIKERIEKKEYPVFVTAGDGKQKLEHILHNQYLDYCYKTLSTISGSLVILGFGFGEYDDHIIDAINKASKRSRDPKEKLWSVYIGVYTAEDLKHAEAIKSKIKCKKMHLFDSKTASIWN